MKHFVLLAFFFVFTGCASPPKRSAAQRWDDERAALQRAHPVTPEIQETRDKLVQEYRTLLTELFPSFNEIGVRVFPNAYGMEWAQLMAEHSMFTPYTFDIGPAGPAVKRWIAEHYTELQRARITTVGLGFGNATYYTGIKPPSPPEL
ncbi:MAG: hypothetical protein H0W20_09505 [Chthoniobacterales bacterium]|nr:hypothetical protein [Chthoniobacterales bacterium]